MRKQLKTLQGRVASLAVLINDLLAGEEVVADEQEATRKLVEMFGEDKDGEAVVEESDKPGEPSAL